MGIMDIKDIMDIMEIIDIMNYLVKRSVDVSVGKNF